METNEQVITRIDERLKALGEKMDKVIKDNEKEHDKVNERLSKLEKFMYIAMGVIALFEFVVKH